MSLPHRLPGGPILAALLALVGLGWGLATMAPAWASDSTEATLKRLEQDPAHRALTADAVKRARQAEERATRLRQAGDEERARIAEGIAAEWASLAQDLVRTADAEARAARARRDADDAGAQAERERGLLDEGIAQNGRLKAQIDQATHEGKEEPAHTSRIGASLDAGPPPRKATPTAGSPRQATDGGAP